MKIYFAGSISGGRDDREIYSRIIDLLGKYGKVLTEHVGDIKLSEKGEIGITDEYIYERDTSWIKEADALVAEVSTPSLGVGYEVAYAEILNKKMLCLYREGSEKRVSAMISGNKNMIIKIYKTIDDLPEIFNKFFK
jgi:nucleoside 2-deoxyribosyltransferase